MKQPTEQDPHSANALGSLQSLASDTKQGCLEIEIKTVSHVGLFTDFTFYMLVSNY